VLNAQEKESFLRKQDCWRICHTPNIVQVHEFAVTQRVEEVGDRTFTEYIPYLVMDFAPGDSCAPLYPAGSCLFIDMAVRYIKTDS